MLAGTGFSYRKHPMTSISDDRRWVYCCNQGIHPWRESTYDFENQKCFRLAKPGYETFDGSTFEQLRARALQAASKTQTHKETEIEGPPDYLRGKVKKPKADGPAALLADGAWCGHGEKTFRIFDIALGKVRTFSFRLPAASVNAPAQVIVTPIERQQTFAIYDSRRHPASVYVDSKAEPAMGTSFVCPRCGAGMFRLSVGFEIPMDSETESDTSWFALAVQCKACGWKSIVYNDETA
jgi:hypothetical protein